MNKLLKSIIYRGLAIGGSITVVTYVLMHFNIIDFVANSDIASVLTSGVVIVTSIAVNYIYEKWK